MQVLLWILLLCAAGALARCARANLQQRRRMDKLQKALQEAKVKIHQQEEAQQGKSDQRENTEDRLRNYLRVLDTLINTMPNPVYYKDAQGVYQGCNQVFAKKILGLTRDRIIGRRPQELPDHIPPDLAATYQRQELIMIQKDGVHSFEAQVRCADGRTRDFLFSLAALKDGNGDVSGSVAVLSDLTEKNFAAQDRLHKEKLQGVLETAGAVCHELNQPLQALSGYTELLGVKMSATEDLTYMDKITGQIERMREITAKLQGITHCETTDYAGNTRIIDIHKSSQTH